MSRKPNLKVARPNYDIATSEDKDLSFCSARETPKIFLQTKSNWTNTTGIVPSYLAFRKLNTTDFTHDLRLTSDTDPYQGAWLNSSGDLGITKRAGDTDMYAILFFDTLDGTPPNTFTDIKRAKFLIANEGVVVTAHPTQLAIDSRFDTFKIFKTGTLVVSAGAETILMGGADKTYTATVVHGLGYPPVYLPAASTGWDLNESDAHNKSFTVNDYIGYYNGFPGQTSYLDVYVDSDKLYMKLIRKGSPYGDNTFSNISITMYYTIFYNEIGEEFNLLNV